MPFVKVQIKDNAGLGLNKYVKSFTFEFDAKKANKATLVLHNYNNVLLEFPEMFDKETEYIIQFGTKDFISNELRLILINAKQGENLTLTFTEKSYLLNKEKVFETWENILVQGIVETIAVKHGYDTSYANSFQNLDVNVTRDIEYTSIVQNTTDAIFLKQLARKTRCKFWIDAAGFHFVDRQELKARRIDFIKGSKDLDYQLLKQTGLEFNLMKNHKTYQLEVPQDVGETITNEKQYTYGAEGVGGETFEENTDYITANNEQEALNLMETKYIDSAMNNLKLKYTVKGNASLIGNLDMGIWGIGDFLSGLYKLTNAKHVISGAYLTEITLQKQAPKRVKRKKVSKKTDGYVQTFTDQTPALPPDYEKKYGKLGEQPTKKKKETEIINYFDTEEGKWKTKLRTL